MSSGHNFLSIEDFYQNYFSGLKEGDLLLDVRTPEEFEESHIKGSINFNHTEILEARSEIDKHDRVFIYCRSGGRAGMAYTTLLDAGAEQSKFFCITDGGMKRWHENGYPV